MPFIEWICVAFIPSLLCSRIVAGYLDCSSLQWFTLVLILSVVVTLVTIILFGETYNRNDSNGHEENKSNTSSIRGTGVVIGSHLMPILYMSIYVLQCDNRCNQPSTDSSCLIGQSNHFNSTLHLKLAMYGGLSFAISNLYKKWQHRKFNSSRLQSKGFEMNGKSCKNTMKQHRSPSLMHMTSTIYAMLLLLDLVISPLLQNQLQNHNAMSTLSTGILHLLLISSHTQSAPPSWQHAFSPGEWMMVSTFITTTIGEFFIQHILKLHTIQLPEHIIVAHAGLCGCILGIVGNICLQRITHGGMEIFPSLGVVVATTVGCLEVALETIVPKEVVVSIPLFGLSVPRSIHWIAVFLTAKPDTDQFGTSVLPFRVMILLYWMIVLIVSLLISVRVASWTTHTTNDTLSKVQNESPLQASTTRKRRVIIARKYFHLVAILLFAPVTYLDPDMMCLSYAIAVALLLILEMVRATQKVLQENEGGITPLNEYYAVFFDEKDAGGGIVVSHIGLVIGCAIPLWVHQLLQCQPQMYGNLINLQLVSLLPYIGVIVLGVGDSAGAIGGLSFVAPTRWPGSTRTLEGSLCMLISMLIAMGLLGIMTGKEPLVCVRVSFLPFAILTLVEASTRQIDNICLPISACTLFILVSCIEELGKRN